MAENWNYEDIPECPLCMELLGLDDVNFYPCSCRYQICRFCWHRIRTDENGLCPHCREPYSENPAEYTPPSQEQIAKMKTEKRQKTQEKKQKLMESRKSLASVRVVQKNLVFVIGLSPRLADPETLKKNEYFGKYGRIYKVVINNSTVYNGAQGPSVSAYVTYYKNDDASKAIQAVNNAYIDGRYLKASFGTTKYCTYFLRGTQCTKPDCMYLHELGDNDASFTKEDMQMGKHQVYETAQLAVTSTTTVATKEQGGGGKKHHHRSKESALDGGAESALPATASWASSKPPGIAEPSHSHLQYYSGQTHSHTHTHSSNSSSSRESSKSHSHSSRETGKTTQHSGSSQKQQQHSHAASSSSSHHHSSSHKSHPGQQHAKHGSHGSVGGGGGGSRHHKSDSPLHTTDSDRSRGSSKSGPTSPGIGHAGGGGSDSGTGIGRKYFQRNESRGSRGSSSSKSATPNLSPKSSISTSSSSGSLKQDAEARATGLEKEAGEAGGSCCEPDQDGTPETVQALQSDGVVEQQGVVVASRNAPSPSDRQLDSSPAGGLVMPSAFDVGGDESAGAGGGSVQFGLGKAVQEDEPAAVKVIEALGSAGSGQFGSLGVSWSAPVPALSAPSPPAQQQEDELGFDPWDVSNKGLADLLETEEKENPALNPAHQPPPSYPSAATNGGLGDGREEPLHPQVDPKSSSSPPTSWEEELRMLFPGVNISVGGPWPGGSSSSKQGNRDKTSSSLHNAVEDSSYKPTFQPAFPYGYTPVHATLSNHGPGGFSNNNSSGSNSHGSYGTSSASEWPDFSSSSSVSGVSTTATTTGAATAGATTMAVAGGEVSGPGSNVPAQGLGTRDSTPGSFPLPPPGFTAKNKDSSAASLSNSINHTFWAVNTAKVPTVAVNPSAVNNPQNWRSSYMHYAALSAASPQQLAAYQQLLAQRQQLIVKAQQQQLLMQGHLGGQAYHHHRQLEPTLVHAAGVTAAALSAGQAGHHGMSLGQAAMTSAGHHGMSLGQAVMTSAGHHGMSLGQAVMTSAGHHGMSLGQAVMTSAGQVISSGSSSGSVYRLPEQAAGTSNGVQTAPVIEQTQNAVQRLKLK